MSGSLGTIAEYRCETPSLQNQRTGVLILATDVHRGYVRFLYQFLSSGIAKGGKGVGVQNISSADIERSVCAIPSIVEQQEVFTEIERRFAIADKVEEAVTQSLRQAQRLRQAILKRAFSGRLVPQDPDDEPAEKLLERIKAAKAAHGAAGRWWWIRCSLCLPPAGRGSLTLEFAQGDTLCVLPVDPTV